MASENRAEERSATRQAERERLIRTSIRVLLVQVVTLILLGLLQARFSLG